MTTLRTFFQSRSRKSAFATFLLVAAPFTLSQSSNTSASLQRYAELAEVPDKARARNNPLESDADAVAAGKKLFAGHCAECHGSTAEGGKKAPSLRAEAVQQATPGALFWVLTNGVVRRGMPVWSKLPEPQRWQLVRYLKSLGPPTVTPPQVDPPRINGANR